MPSPGCVQPRTNASSSSSHLVRASARVASTSGCWRARPRRAAWRIALVSGDAQVRALAASAGLAGVRHGVGVGGARGSGGREPPGRHDIGRRGGRHGRCLRDSGRHSEHRARAGRVDPPGCPTARPRPSWPGQRRPPAASPAEGHPRRLVSRPCSWRRRRPVRRSMSPSRPPASSCSSRITWCSRSSWPWPFARTSRAMRRRATVAGHRLPVSVTVQGTVNPTGPAEPLTERARGTVTFSNHGPNPVTIPDETVVATATGVEFETDGRQQRSIRGRPGTSTSRAVQRGVRSATWTRAPSPRWTPVCRTGSATAP